MLIIAQGGESKIDDLLGGERMPKVNLLPGNAYKAQMGRLIKSRMVLYGLHREDVAKVMQCDKRTVTTRCKDPGGFTLAELQLVCKQLKMEVVITENGVECR